MYTLTKQWSIKILVELKTVESHSAVLNQQSHRSHWQAAVSMNENHYLGEQESSDLATGSISNMANIYTVTFITAYCLKMCITITEIWKKPSNTNTAKRTWARLV